MRKSKHTSTFLLVIYLRTRQITIAEIHYNHYSKGFLSISKRGTLVPDDYSIMEKWFPSILSSWTNKPVMEIFCCLCFYLPSVTSWWLEVRSLAGSSATVASELVAPDISLIGSLRLVSGTLSRELNLTRELDRELRSGLVSDKPGMSSIFVGVTMNRTEAILVVFSEGCIFLFLFLYKDKEKRKNPAKPFLLC